MKSNHKLMISVIAVFAIVGALCSCNVTPTPNPAPITFASRDFDAETASLQLEFDRDQSVYHLTVEIPADMPETYKSFHVLIPQFEIKLLDNHGFPLGPGFDVQGADIVWKLLSNNTREGKAAGTFKIDRDTFSTIAEFDLKDRWLHP